MRVDADSLRQRGRRCNAGTHAEYEHRTDRQQHGEVMREHRAEENQRAENAECVCPDRELVDRQARDQPGSRHAAEPHAGEQDRRIDSDLVVRAAELMGEDEGRDADESVHRGRGAAAANGEAQERR